MKDEFFGITDDTDRDYDYVRPSNRCTPETLLDFLQRTWRSSQRSPTLQEVKHEFGGILSAIFAGWELEKQGKLKDGKPTGV